jgi:ubiquinone/menaquinone biosynthesis C-methylase UbiE
MPIEVESPNQAMVPVCETIMSSRGGLDGEKRLLDFGCGVGRHVREFRAHGYDAVGVDRPYEGLAEALEKLPDGGENLFLTSPDGQFPFETATFDFCYSTSVFEHVMSYDKSLGEIARVLKRDAWTLHIFPSRWRPIEPHMFTPFGGRFQQGY